MDLSPSSNQFTNTPFSYDASGNILTDGHNTYGWNAESEIKSAGGVNYTYDGDGDRVEKSNGKIYWYGAGTEILDESDLSGNITDEYIFFGGKRIARRDSSNNVVYYAADYLGSSRVITNSTGGILDQSDFYPFGGERVLSSSSGNTYKFEGKERDTETNNDDFGARYYSSQFGRWTSPDWSAIPVPVPYANLSNPQTLNLYAMVRDNPETFADLDGHEYVSAPQADGASISFDYVPDAGQQEAAAQQAAKNNPANSDKTAEPQTTTQQPSISQSTAQPTGGNRTPSTGAPDTTERVPGASPGSYGERSYGPDGRAKTDIDHGHDHTGVGDPHAHDWVNGERQAPRSLTPEERAGADIHQFSAWVSDHKGTLLTAGAVIIVVGAVALAPATGGASLGALAVVP
jgi:RHS repeat-associated protein